MDPKTLCKSSYGLYIAGAWQAVKRTPAHLPAFRRAISSINKRLFISHTKGVHDGG